MKSGLAIEIDSLTKQFNGFTAVDGISLDVHAGEVFAFLGPNGAGKSTTIKMLCTLLKPTSGRALVDGYDVMSEPDDVRASIGIVFQDSSLDNYLTADQNLRFHCKIYHVPKTEREERIKSVLELVDLSDRRFDLVRNFSGGMKRRLEIARGLLHRPRVLFLDEPTVGLDPQTRRYVWEHILQLKEEGGATIFMTTHYMDEAEHADRIAIIDRGKIAASGTPVELKRQISGDIVTLSTVDDNLAGRELKETFGLEVRFTPEGLTFEVRDGDDFIPRAVKALTPGIRRISTRRPSLDDVFLNLTGRAIREEEPGGGARGRVGAKIRRGRSVK